MINTITLGRAPPPGRYSSGSRGILSARPAHPAAPSSEAPATPAPATFKKSPRVNALLGFLLTPGRLPQYRAKLALYQHFSWSARSALAGFARQHVSLREPLLTSKGASLSVL